MKSNTLVSSLDAVKLALAKYSKARSTPVLNFVTSAPSDKMANSCNLEMDAASYRWDSSTINAIRYALKKCGKGY